jgi:SAM-dependent methyltransferase
MDLMTAAGALRTYEGNPFSREVHPADQMWNTGPAWYWDVGRYGLDCLIKGLLASPLPKPGSILDLACGYGRVSRHIRSAFPDTRLIWCDLEGPEFCVKHFGGEAIASAHELLTVELPRVDAIWIGSLFTHVPEWRARAWLAHVAACLNSGGVMIATFHGRTTADLYRREIPSMAPLVNRTDVLRAVTGWGFEPYGADPDWGFSMTSVGRFAEVAADVPDTRIGGLVEGGWSANQDVLVLVKK